jgi:hypothetical protein
MTANFASRKAHARAGAASINAEIDKSLATLEADRVARAAEVTAARLSAREAEKARVKLTRADLLGSTFVQTTNHQWHQVVRVNQTSVTVDSDFGDRLIPMAQIKDGRTL